MTSIGTEAQAAGQQVRQSEWIDHAARIGLVTYGVMHLVVAWLAIQLALGDNSGSPDQQGAIQQLKEQPFGEFLVWAVGIGMLLLAVWQLLEGIFGYRDEEGMTRVRKRLTAVGKAVVYTIIGISAIHSATGSSSTSKKNSTDSTTAKIMDWPGGQAIVCLIGAGIIIAGGYLVYRAYSEKFAKHINAEGRSGETGKAYLLFGKVGYTAKGITFGIIGGLFLYAGLTHNAKKSGGLDQALHKVLQQPFGPVLLIAVALGLACYGLFCFARARHFND
jgi:hypothetical protein